MTPSQLVFERMLVLLGDDTLTFKKTNPGENLIILISQPFTPAPTLVRASVTEADFDGYAARAIQSGTEPQSVDPATGDSLLSLPADDTSYLWETTGTTNLPQTIYGFAVVDSTDATLYASQLLPNGPVTLTAINQSINLSLPQLRQLAGSVS